MENGDEREEELSTLSAIYPELKVDDEEPFAATLELEVKPTTPLLVRFIPAQSPPTTSKTYSQAAASNNSAAHIEHDIELGYLPSLTLQIKLPHGYPAEKPPTIRISTKYDWLPRSKVNELQEQLNDLWEEYGRCQILFAYIDYLQQQAESGFQLDHEGCLVLSGAIEAPLVDFDRTTRQALFEANTYDCEICLEPKKGSTCYQLRACGHVFCRSCLQDFYNSAIAEGNVAGVKCLAPDCGKEGVSSRKRRSLRLLQPRELLDMGIQHDIVRRYVEMKRKKKIEADKNTVYCPRTWCQGPAKSSKYPPLPADVSAFTITESDGEGDDQVATNGTRTPTQAQGKLLPPDPSDRLAVCEKCSFAFCKVCYMGWHGPFARCYPRDPSELSAEEKASYEYIRMHTSPCPYCNSPTQKTMGCNHMQCFQCRTHFCYLCTSWLDAENPYQHFNKPGTDCYQRLWELEEGDDGQAPADGRGFAGGRHWEQIAIEVAREADEREAAEAAEAAQAEEEARAAQQTRDARANVANQLVEPMARLEMANQRALPQAPTPPVERGPRWQRNPFPRHPPGRVGAGNAVRNHERNRGANIRQQQPAAVVQDRQ